jgi:hypothetical protein
MFALSIALTLAASVATPAVFDRLLLKDGRAIECKIVDEDDPTYLTIEIRGTEIPVRHDLIESTYVENLENYVPKNKKEEDYLKKGWVLFEGRWMSKSRRDGELKKRANADKAAIAEAKKAQDWRNARVSETRHFVFRTNCTQEVGDEAINRLEAYYKYFTDSWGITLSPGAVRGKMQFFLYRNNPDFLRVTGMPYGVGGFFSSATGELHLYNNYLDPAETRGVLFHEGNHLLTYLIDTKFSYPTWLNEGMAEYYGTAEIDEKGKFQVGGLQYGRIVSLRTDELADKVIPLRDVLLMEHKGFRARHYAVAWSFVHYLMESPDYQQSFRSFFAKLSKNKYLEVENRSYSNVIGSVKIPTLESVMFALEKQLGKSVDELEAEWRDWTAQSYGELTAMAYYKAARAAMFTPQDDGSHVNVAFENFEKAVEMDIQLAECYRAYAELLRKGGVLEGNAAYIVKKPNPGLAWDVIQTGIDLAPLNPLNYTEAAGILILDGPVQDLDRAADLAATALAIAGSRNYTVRSMHDELMALIEPARENARTRAEMQAELDASDQRTWMVMPFYYEGDPVPERMEDLSTQDIRALIEAEAIKGEDHVYQTWREEDPETGDLIPGENLWDTTWVPLKDVPVFAEDLAEAAGSGTR